MNRPPTDPREADPLFAALKDLPDESCAPDVERRIHRRSRSLYLQAQDGSSRDRSVLAVASRVVVPLSLAGIVVLYMAWAIDAALIPFR